ncbi:hypothetical protein CTU88_14435 [Streptomyces sp. JV178]|nr:hypothetical protein CTU88_14435 [Streptomyces sp. JV178]
MSRVGVWPLGVEDIRARARAAAGQRDVSARMAAYRHLCEELGEWASWYVDPLTAARVMAREAARAFQAERKGVHV